MSDPILDLVEKISARARELADLPMPALRKVAEADITTNTRGKLIEWVLSQEFDDEAKRFDDKYYDVNYKQP